MDWNKRRDRRTAQIRRNGADLAFSRGRVFIGYIARHNVALGEGTEEDGDPEESGFTFEVEADAFDEVDAPDAFEYGGQDYEVVQKSPVARGGVVLLTRLLCRAVRRP